MNRPAILFNFKLSSFEGQARIPSIEITEPISNLLKTLRDLKLTFRSTHQFNVASIFSRTKRKKIPL